MRKPHDQSGLTLLELLVAIAIGAILVTAAVPSMQSYNAKGQVKAHQRSVENALKFAREQAVTQGNFVTICDKDSAAETCNAGAADWTNGWLIFLDDDRNGEFGVGDQLLQVKEYEGRNVLRVFDIDGSGELNNQINSITWNFRGFTDDDSRAFLVVCDGDLTDQYAKGLMVARSGRVLRTTDEDSNGIEDFIFDGGVRTDIGC
jgi:type IV fimbrial biogenesis protein FimT